MGGAIGHVWDDSDVISVIILITFLIACEGCDFIMFSTSFLQQMIPLCFDKCA